ncbi:stage III sporulation protein AE [Clostridium sp. D33t1_170424_F3]|uniref:stage III sporulation protein AE n=1 Tax=Clostridium sp. D33t1_170424_F3 TaxID=2787099 RepID=UPI0018A9AD58|nr:stage III sporulation protein AE [Clostridium sp. D33t1_170424_F3]
MKRTVCLVFLLFLALFCAPCAYAEGVEDFYSEQMQQSGAEDLPDSLPQETRETLESLGIDGVDWQALTSITPESIFSEIGSMAAEHSQGPLHAAASVVAVMLLCALCSGMKLSFGEKQLGGVVGMVGALCVCAVVVAPIVSFIQQTADIIHAAAGFLLACVPVLTGIMLAAGQPVSSGSYNLLMMAAGNVISIVSAGVLVPLLNIFLALSIVSAVSPGVNLGGICDAFHKVVKWILGLCMTVFTGLLTVHSIVASSLDGTAAKAAKFVVSSFVPVVGSALGEALQTVTGCVKMLKSGIGAFGLLAGAFIFLPVILQCILWMATLAACEGIGDIFELKEITSLLKAVSKALQIILAIVLCCMTILTVSTVIMLAIGGGGN